jgi:hypothetical protein
VALPAEHGGWGLTLEPGLLGFLVAPGIASLLLGLAAVGAFLVRTPLRLTLIDQRRGPEGRSASGAGRARLARRVAAAEMVALALAVVGAAWLAADPRWWLPGLLAAPLFVVALWYDRRARSRELLPEVVGPVAVASVSSMGALAGGAAWPLAIGLWLILGARVSSSVPHVRAQVSRLHGRSVSPAPGLVGDALALLLAGAAVAVEPSLVAGSLAVVALVIVQRVTLARPPRPARVLGMRQMALGLGLVVATVLGVWIDQG